MKAPDLINLQKWMKKAPKEFDRAGANVLNSTAFKGRRRAISNIKKGTNTRTPKFVDRSMRVTKARVGKPLNQLVAIMGSIDISRQGRSSGFKELESGRKSDKTRAATLSSRGNSERKKIAGPVRMDKLNRMFRHRMVRGKGLKSKRQRVAAMLKIVRSGAIGRQPFIIPRGVKSGPMSRMRPGVYRMGNKKVISLQNPFRSRMGNTKRIKWMSKSIDWATNDANITKAWKKEAEFVLRKRRKR